MKHHVRLYYTAMVEVEIEAETQEEALEYCNCNAMDIADSNREQIIENIALQETETEIC